MEEVCVNTATDWQLVLGLVLALEAWLGKTKMVEPGSLLEAPYHLFVKYIKPFILINSKRGK